MNRKPSTPSRGSARATARLSTALVVLLLVAPTGALAAAPPTDAAPTGPVLLPGATDGTDGHSLPQCGGLCIAGAVSAAAAVVYGWSKYCADQPNKPSCWWTEKPGQDGGDGGNGGNGGHGGAGCRGTLSVSLGGCCSGEGGSGGRGGDGGNGGSGRGDGDPGDGGDAGDAGDDGEDGQNVGLSVTGCGADALPRLHFDSD